MHLLSATWQNLHKVGTLVLLVEVVFQKNHLKVSIWDTMLEIIKIMYQKTAHY
jgi:hypothetical protein